MSERGPAGGRTELGGPDGEQGRASRHRDDRGRPKAAQKRRRPTAGGRVTGPPALTATEASACETTPVGQGDHAHTRADRAPHRAEAPPRDRHRADEVADAAARTDGRTDGNEHLHHVTAHHRQRKEEAGGQLRENQLTPTRKRSVCKSNHWDTTRTSVDTHTLLVHERGAPLPQRSTARAQSKCR